jgi:phosphatidylglycerol:prolipoprotein diacylglycerol transferase
MFALGFGLAILAGELNARRLGLPSWLYVESSLYIAVAAVLGARLLYVALEWGHYAGQPWRILNTREGGLSLYGGLLGGVLAVWVFTRLRGVPTGRFLDGGAPAIALGTAITRVGCFLEGCCWGVPTRGTWGVLTRFAPGLRHPAQLYEMVLDLVLFGVLWYLAPRLRRIPGQLFLFYVAGYSAIRFAVEFWRDVPHLWGWVTVTQPAALLAVVSSLCLAWYRWRRQVARACAPLAPEVAEGPGPAGGEGTGSPAAGESHNL